LSLERLTAQLQPPGNIRQTLTAHEMFDKSSLCRGQAKDLLGPHGIQARSTVLIGQEENRSDLRHSHQRWQPTERVNSQHSCASLVVMEAHYVSLVVGGLCIDLFR